MSTSNLGEYARLYEQSKKDAHEYFMKFQKTGNKEYWETCKAHLNSQRYYEQIITSLEKGDVNE